MTTTNRIEEYLRSDSVWTTHRGDAVLATPASIISEVRKTKTTINLQYFVGTAQHESNFALNERDTEVGGFQSWGVFQLSEPEALRAGLVNISAALKLPEAVKAMVYQAEKIRGVIRRFLQLTDDQTDPPGIEPFLALGYNQGIGRRLGQGLLGTLSRHGLDWSGYVARNPTINIVAHGYGNDVLPLNSPLRKAAP